MEQINNQVAAKEKKSSSNSYSVRVTKDGQKKLTQLLNKANKKDYGKKIKGYQLLELGLSLISDSHIKKLQEGSLSNADQLEILYREHIKKNGKISKDEFIGLLLTQKINDAA